MYMYIYLVKQCVQKLKEGTDKLKLMIEVKNTRIIQVCVGVGGEGAQGPGVLGGGFSATKRDTLSFKFEGKGGLGSRVGVRWKEGAWWWCWMGRVGI